MLDIAKFDNSFKSELEEVISQIQVGTPEDSNLAMSHSEKDIFGEKQRAKWKGLHTSEARCDFTPNRRLCQHSGVHYICAWRQSKYGMTLTEIKSDPEMVETFAKNLAELITDVLGDFLSQGGFALVTTPKRRHLVNNFSTLTTARTAELLNLPFYEDCAFAKNKKRVNAVFIPNNIPKEPNVIVIDDFVTTGSTIKAMRNLLLQYKKNLSFFTGIDNNR